MNIALIIAGGVGSRTGQHVPKQFINVLDKPIIVYTMENFQKLACIDAIEVVCLAGWEQILEAYALQYGISKLKWIVPGGSTGQESIYNGLKNLAEVCGEEDVVIIHDGIRPMVGADIVDSCLEVCHKHGNGITALPVYEQVFEVATEESTNEYIPRERLRILQTPQAYRFGTIKRCYDKAFSEHKGLHSSSYANTLMVDMGETLYFAKGSTLNIKITTAEDIAIFKAMLLANDKQCSKEKR